MSRGRTQFHATAIIKGVPKEAIGTRLSKQQRDGIHVEVGGVAGVHEVEIVDATGVRVKHSVTPLNNEPGPKARLKQLNDDLTAAVQRCVARGYMPSVARDTQIELTISHAKA